MKPLLAVAHYSRTLADWRVLSPDAPTTSGVVMTDASLRNDGNIDLYTGEIAHADVGANSDRAQLLTNVTEQGQPARFNRVDRTTNGLVPTLARTADEGVLSNAMFDFDNDGRMDISLSRTDKYESSYTTELQKGWFGLMHQTASGMFEALDRSVGLTDEDGGPGMKGAQNHAWSDIDRDGDLDLLVGARDQGGGRANLLFRNDLGSKHHWLGLRLVGGGAVNRDAIGARVTLTVGDTTLGHVWNTLGKPLDVDEAELFVLDVAEGRVKDWTTIAIRLRDFYQ